MVISVSGDNFTRNELRVKLRLTLLDDERPIEAIARGHYRAVSRLVAQLENDSFS